MTLKRHPPGLAWHLEMKRRLLRQGQRLHWKPRQNQKADYPKLTLAKPQTSRLILTIEIRLIILCVTVKSVPNVLMTDNCVSFCLN